MNNVDLTIPGNGSYELKLRRATNWLHHRSEHQMGLIRDKQGRIEEPANNGLGDAIAALRMAAKMQILNTAPVNQDDRMIREHISRLDGDPEDELYPELFHQELDALWELHRKRLSGPIPSSYRLLWIGREE